MFQIIYPKKTTYTFNHLNKILYSFHAEEVECIGKGKLHKPYEFGNKVGLGVSGRGNFILGVKLLHGNPYDGHTLNQTIEKIESTTGQEVGNMFVDLGYCGNNYQKKGKIYTPRTKKTLTHLCYWLQFVKYKQQGYGTPLKALSLKILIIY